MEIKGFDDDDDDDDDDDKYNHDNILQGLNPEHS